MPSSDVSSHPLATSEIIRARGEDVVVSTRSYTVVSLYSGAGGLDLGFRTAGFDLVWATDSDPDAVESYKANLGDHIVYDELPKAGPPGDLRPDIVIGGPPCQGFSVIGRMNPSDPSSRHVYAFLDCVERLEPRAFCMENVKALATSSRWRRVRDALLQRGRELEYRLELLVLNAADYRVPQSRKRMFLVGIRGGSPLCPVRLTASRPPTARCASRGATSPRIATPASSSSTADGCSMSRCSCGTRPAAARISCPCASGSPRTTRAC